MGRVSLRDLGRRALGAIDAVLGTYAQIVFSRSRVAGALLLAATATDPRLLAFGLLSLAAARATAALLGVGADAAGASPLGYNAVLVGLGVGHAYAASPGSVALGIAAAGAVVLVTAAMTSALSSYALPALSLPFVLVTWGLVATGGALGLEPALAPGATPALADEPLAAAGALLFAPHAVAGALVLAALAVHSRIAAVLALLATGAVALLGIASPALATPPVSASLALNAALASVAIGGVWFVPSLASAGLGLAAAAASVGLSLGLAGPLSRAGLPSLILPFQAGVWLVLLATRQRAFDRSPKSVDFVPGSPEENLAYYRTRLARFRALYAIAFRLPFRGAWVCTQGNDGALTHKGAWRHGFDFEVRGPDGRLFRGEGAALEDHHCFRLPVLAAADGVVVRVVDDVADNHVGGMDLERNWGNCVVVQHGVGLFSLVAHLVRGGAKVHVGQPVRRGDVLGACGSSGRSPRPHLHFQLQTTAALGAPTLPCRFSDAIVRGEPDQLVLAEATTEGQEVRNLEPDEALAGSLAIEPGRAYAFTVDGRVEHLEHEVDLLGQLVLRSRERGATLVFVRTADLFTAYDALGPSRSALHLLRAALPRVPLDAAEGLEWVDYLPARALGSAVSALLTPASGLEMRYRLRRSGDRLEVTGASVRQRAGKPLVTTSARLGHRWIESLEVRTAGRVFRAERAEDAAGGSSGSVRPKATPDRARVAAGIPARLATLSWSRGEEST